VIKKKLNDMKLRNMRIARIAVVGLFTLAACDLDTVPESNLSDGIFWKTDNDFRQATNDLYKASVLDGWVQEYPAIADVMSDNAFAKTPDFTSNISDGSYLPGANFGPWNHDYSLIRVANNIIERARAAGFSSTQLPRFKAEAKFFRAYAYQDLVNRYGDVPLILKTLDTSDEELYAPRTDVQVVVDSIYADLDYAAAHLPKASELKNATEYGMATSGAALALKSRVALRRGTWKKFHNEGSYQQDLQVAKDAALAVTNSGEYTLFDLYGTDSYRQLFKAKGEGPGNHEAIWVWMFGETAIRYSFFPPKAAQGAYSLTRTMIDSYLCTDGLPIEKSPLYQGQQNSTSEFVDRDPRMDGTVVKKGDIYGYGTPYIPALIGGSTGYHIEKNYDVVPATGQQLQNIDLIIIRYGEVLLNYAEAVYELGDAISDADLDASINKLRDRVAMPHLTNAFVTANGLNMRDEIRRERRVELAMEGLRYDDLLRWKTAETELPKPLLGVRLFAAEYPDVDPSAVSMTADSIVIAEPASKRSFDPTKQYLWPLPITQLALNPSLDQNPNW
jgi:hypothetical protein